MNDWTYNQAHIQSWAEFSGDFNPIHFVPERARLVGAPGVIVHGMLPLLRLKQEVAEIATSPDADDWLRINCRFKQPLRRDATHELKVSAGASQGKFSLRAILDDTECIQGGFSFCKPDTKFGQDSSMSVARLRVREKLEEFGRVFPSITHLWIGLDAIVFSHFLNSELPFAIARKHGLAGAATSQAELLEHSVAMQTMHSVSIAPTLRARPLGWGFPVDVRCHAAEPVVVRNSPTELAGLQQLDVHLDGVACIRLEIGILLRTNQIEKEG